MCVDLIEYADNETLLDMHNTSMEMYQISKRQNDVLSMQFWALDLEKIEKELAERGLMTEVTDG